VFTNRARASGFDAMELSRTEQIWISIAGVDRASKERCQSGALIE
jgi:hypothetical protein